jgi:hypothetical protein
VSSRGGASSASSCGSSSSSSSSSRSAISRAAGAAKRRSCTNDTAGRLLGASSLGSRTVRYEVRVSDGSRFKHEQDEELKVRGTLHQFSMVYKVKAIRPLSVEESDEFDAIAEVDWLAGPRPPYALRHTYATFSIAAGVSLFALARRMGTSVQQIDKTLRAPAPRCRRVRARATGRVRRSEAVRRRSRHAVNRPARQPFGNARRRLHAEPRLPPPRFEPPASA